MTNLTKWENKIRDFISIDEFVVNPIAKIVTINADKIKNIPYEYSFKRKGEKEVKCKLSLVRVLTKYFRQKCLFHSRIYSVPPSNMEWTIKFNFAASLRQKYYGNSFTWISLLWTPSTDAHTHTPKQEDEIFLND